MTWYTFVNGTASDADEVNANFAETPRKGQNETVTADWTFKTTGGTTNLIIDAPVGDYDSRLVFNLEGVNKWVLGVDDSSSDRIFLYDNSNTQDRMYFYQADGIDIISPGQTSTTPTTASTFSLRLQDSGSSVGNGGFLVFGASQGFFSGIKGNLTSGTSNTTGTLDFYTRNATGDATLTRACYLDTSQQLNMASHKIVSVADPTSAQDAATMNYVDTRFAKHTPNAFGGTGADGALNVTSGTTSLAGNAIKNYTTINVSVGATLDLSSGNWLWLKATGNVTIAGTIDLSGRGGAGGAGGSGDNGNAGGAGGGILSFVATDLTGGSGGLAASTKGGGGGKSFSTLYPFNEMPVSHNFVVFYGSGGGGGGAPTGVGGNGGNGGGCLIIETAGTITISGTIDCSADNGSQGSGTADWGGGGGGGGGSFLVIAKGAITESSPTYNVAKGTGGTTGGGSTEAGQDGVSNGFYQIVRDTSVS